MLAIIIVFQRRWWTIDLSMSSEVKSKHASQNVIILDRSKEKTGRIITMSTMLHHDDNIASAFRQMIAVNDLSRSSEVKSKMAAPHLKMISSINTTDGKGNREDNDHDFHVA